MIDEIKTPRKTLDDHIRYLPELGKRRDAFLDSYRPHKKGYISELWVKAMDEFLKKRGY